MPQFVVHGIRVGACFKMKPSLGAMNAALLEHCPKDMKGYKLALFYSWHYYGMPFRSAHCE